MRLSHAWDALKDGGVGRAVGAGVIAIHWCFAVPLLGQLDSPLVLNPVSFISINQHTLEVKSWTWVESTLFIYNERSIEWNRRHLAAGKNYRGQFVIGVVLAAAQPLAAMA